jgi:DNA-binding transcriptional LysR family regulator
MASQIISHLPAIQTLVLVVDTGSFTQAGKKLGLSPSGVSKQLARLEELLGARLFERTTRKVRPTLAGLALCQRARPLFESFEDAARDVKQLGEHVGGQLRISAAPAFGRAVLMPVLRDLGTLHPDLRFQITLTGRRLDFVEDDIDLAIREGSLPDSSLVARPLMLAHVGLYASRAYVKKHGAPRSVADLGRHDLVMIPRPQRGVGMHPDLAHLALHPRFQVDDLASVMELAEAGAGIAPLPDYLTRAALAHGRLVRVLPRTNVATFPIHAVYPSRRHLPRRVQVVIDALMAPRSR